MSAYFKLFAVLVVFLCLYCHEVDAQKKDWIKGIGDKINDAKKMISSKFNRETLDKFLQGGPKLWAKKVLSAAQKLIFRKSLGTKTPSKEELDKLASLADKDEDETIHNHALFGPNLPASFDARTNWPQCPGIKEIASQTQCGSCWAVSTTYAMSDRLCIATNGTRQSRISAMDLLSCCSKCKGGDEDGCQGGFTSYAYEYYQLNGLVTGGAYGDTKTCIPYKWAPDAASGFGAEFVSPKCEAKCKNPINYSTNKHYGTNLRVIRPGDTTEIMKQLYTKGPLAVAFMVTESFMEYNGGIFYKTQENEPQLGGHAVRLIGWGEEKGVPYWTIANSWGSNWGESGTFRIIRGRNEFGIEDNAVAGDYDIRRSTKE